MIMMCWKLNSVLTDQNYTVLNEFTYSMFYVSKECQYLMFYHISKYTHKLHKYTIYTSKRSTLYEGTLSWKYFNFMKKCLIGKMFNQPPFALPP